MFQVDWPPDPSNQLAEIWATAADLDAVSDASFAIDEALARHPENEGESRDADERVTFYPPLGVRFHVNVAVRVVTVMACWRIGQR